MDKLTILIRQKLRNNGMWDEFVRVFNVLLPECDPETTVLSAGDMYIVLGMLDSFPFEDVLWALISQKRHNDITSRLDAICAHLEQMKLHVDTIDVLDESAETDDMENNAHDIDQANSDRVEAEQFYNSILELHKNEFAKWFVKNPDGGHREYFATLGYPYCLQRRSEAGHPIPANDRAHIYAARAGHVNVIKWLIDNEQPNLLEICEAAASADQRDVLDYMFVNHRCMMDELTTITKSAAAAGNTLTTQYLLVHHISPCEEIAEVAPPELASWIRSMML